MTRALIAALTVVPLAVAPAAALDHKNLDEHRPLRLEDAYAIAHGELAVEIGGGFRLARRGRDQGVFPIELLYGALANVQLGVGTTVFTDPHEVHDRPKSGDLHLSGLYNLNQETLEVPAFAAKLGVDLPTGVDAKGVGVDVKGIVTKSIERLSLHLNAGYALFTDTQRGERDGRYELALGFSYPVGAPHFTRATLVGDVFAEQAARRGESTTVGVELGLRFQLTSRVVWDVGVGTEFAGPADRSRLLFQTGFSFGF